MIALVLGGARSGKSAVAEDLARAAAGPAGTVHYLATAVVSDADEDLAARVAAHVARRPPSWTTEELPLAGDLAGALQRASGVVLVDSLATWVAGAPDFTVDGAALTAALTGRAASTVLVSDEVGLGVHPVSEAGRRFRDALGELNQAVAAVADRALFVVAGRTLELGATTAERG